MFALGVAGGVVATLLVGYFVLRIGVAYAIAKALGW